MLFCQQTNVAANAMTAENSTWQLSRPMRKAMIQIAVIPPAPRSR